MSRLLLENSNKDLEIAIQEDLGTAWNTGISSFGWHTPKAGKELRL